jgi:hypothetical protein
MRNNTLQRIQNYFRAPLFALHQVYDDLAVVVPEVAVSP